MSPVIVQLSNENCNYIHLQVLVIKIPLLLPCVVIWTDCHLTFSQISTIARAYLCLLLCAIIVYVPTSVAISFNVVFLSSFRFAKWYLCSRFPPQIPFFHFSSPYMVHVPSIMCFVILSPE